MFVKSKSARIRAQYGESLHDTGVRAQATCYFSIGTTNYVYRVSSNVPYILDKLFAPGQTLVAARGERSTPEAYILLERARGVAATLASRCLRLDERLRGERWANILSLRCSCPATRASILRDETSDGVNDIGAMASR